jgi:hypothetical protein
VLGFERIETLSPSPSVALGRRPKGLSPEVVEQFIKNWRRQNEAQERSQTENRLLHELLRRQRIEKYGFSSEQLSDEQLEHPEEEAGVGRPEVVIDPEPNRSDQDPELA